MQDVSYPSRGNSAGGSTTSASIQQPRQQLSLPSSPAAPPTIDPLLPAPPTAVTPSITTSPVRPAPVLSSVPYRTGPVSGAKPVHALISGPVVIAVVGPKREEFHLHKDLLLDRSMLLEKRLKRDPPYGKHRGMQYLCLSDEPVAAFKIFIQWLYGATLITPSCKNRNDYINLYIMAHYLGVESLTNTTMDLIREGDRQDNWEWSLELLFNVYYKIPRGSPLRDFLLRITVWTGEWDSNPLINYPKFLHREGSLVPKFLITHEAHSKSKLADPRKEANCTFHEHKHTKKCGRERRSKWRKYLSAENM